ncbi:HNH endonuclease [Bacillus phage vB_BanS-Thrax2]|nr:HNH endonuclease [Bacillus phage vB_BanS-Thrax2]
MIGMRNGKEKAKIVREEIESRGCTLLNDYVDEKTKLIILCENGHERNCRYRDFKKYNCKKCVNEEKLHKLITSIEELGYTLITHPVNAKSVISAYCKKGHIREAKIHNFLKFGCPECTGKNVKKNIEICRSVFNSRGFRLIEDTYIDCKTPMKYLCSCGEEKTASLDSIMNHDTDSCNKCKGKKVSGELAPNWQGGLTPKNSLLRRNSRYREWRTSVFIRDKYTCQCCNSVGGNLRGHHILNFSDNEDIRYDINNGITLCDKCHDIGQEGSFHDIYGTYNNTKEQLEEFLGRKI